MQLIRHFIFATGVLFALQASAGTQTYTTADVISYLNRLSGFRVFDKAQSPTFSWRDMTYTASVDGTVVTIQGTETYTTQNGRTGANCALDVVTHFTWIFDIRDMQASVEVIPQGGPGNPNEKRAIAVLKTKDGKPFIRKMTSTGPPTCPQPVPADIYLPGTKSDDNLIALYFMEIDTAAQFKTIVASAWQSR